MTVVEVTGITDHTDLIQEQIPLRSTKITFNDASDVRTRKVHFARGPYFN